MAAAESAGWPFLQGPLERNLARTAGVPVRLEGRFALHLFGRPRLAVEHLNVGAGGGLGKADGEQREALPHLVDARGIELAWRWRDLWQWWRGDDLRVAGLVADDLDARLVRTADGRASWQLGRERAAPARPDDLARESMPRFGLVRVNRGHVVVDDRPFDTALEIALEGGEGAGTQAPREGARLSDDSGGDSGYRAHVKGRWQALPLDLAVRSGAVLPLVQDLQIEGRDGAAPDLALRVEGRAGAAQVFFEGRAGALTGERRLDGAVRVAGPSLAEVGAPFGLTLPHTRAFELRGRLSHDGGLWQLAAERAAIGRSRLAGEFRFDSRAHPRRLIGRLGGPLLALDDLGPSVGAASTQAGRPAPAEATPPGRVLPRRRFDLPSLRAMDADVQVAIDELDFAGRGVASLQALAARVRLAGGVLTLDDLRATVAGGRFAGRTSLDATQVPARWAVDLELAAVDIAGWLRAVRRDEASGRAPSPNDTAALKRERQQARAGGEQPARAYVTGILGGHVKASGQGRSVAEILGTLDGQADLTLRDGSVSHLVTEATGLDLAQALGVWVRGDRPLPLTCARLALEARDGLVRTRTAVLDNRDSTLHVAGQVNLRDESLALRAQARPKDFSPLSLRTPVRVGGTLADPAIGIEGKRLAGRVLGALALGAAVGPAAALLPLIDPGQREPDPCAATGTRAAGAAPQAASAAAPRRP